ncbi:unnamed protein product [Ambrosiozyma monospora]|uniref:Unnamed protein product n=1 Tax=Ambrosiozyma monospora TaxID=43982 RepID=A0A9W6Z082_AMBMO|nr:unnamed protein product [Ambrosiozyma monospora]
MAKYYCDYCKSYLTHDSLSVRKSHLIGKYHVKFYCDFYERIQKREKKKLLKRKKEIKAEPLYEYDMKQHYKGMPGLPPSQENTSSQSAYQNHLNSTYYNSRQDTSSPAKDTDSLKLKPYKIMMPPTLSGLPPPPPNVYYYNTYQEKKEISELVYAKKKELRQQRLK